MSNSTTQKSITFDASIYIRDALLRAVYDCAALGTFVITSKDICFEVSLAATPSSEFSWNSFIETATDHQLRLDAERQFGTIREILLLQALAPVENLSSLLPAQEI